MAEAERKRKMAKRRERLTARLLKEESEEEEEFTEEEGVVDGFTLSSLGQCNKIVTKLVGKPEPSQFPWWGVRSIWQLASILNFLNVFRPLLNIKVEFSVEEFETALITPNNTLWDKHMPILKVIPPVTRMALRYGTWITVLCRKLRDWWHWVAEGDLPIVASHGTEVEVYSSIDPEVRVVILKALCDISVEQEDVRNYIDDSIKHEVKLSTFREERIGGDSHGISCWYYLFAWYENDPIFGHQLYREIRKVGVKKGKGKNVPPFSHSSYQWEPVATNLDKFLGVSKKEKLLKKQYRQALMLDSMTNLDGLAAGRSLRDRKHVTFGGIRFISLLFLVLLQFLDISLALPLCTDSRAPYAPNYRAAFCAYNETTCCNYAKNMQLKQQFSLMNISDPHCASLLKSILCARCDPFSAELFRIGSVPREVPVLCNSTVSQDSTQSYQAANNFCSKVWNSCQNVSIINSPFFSSLQGRAGILPNTSSTKLTNIWQSQSDFCDALGGASDDGMTCFTGEPVMLNSTGIPNPPNGMCLEKIGNGSYLNMVAHPDGSNRAFFSNQQGVIWLATIPDGSRGILELDETHPFLDLTDEVHFDTEFGLLGIAFHPKFLENGRFFASFSCDKANGPNCDGRCACNSDVNCDPSKLSPDSGAEPCRYQSVIAEFSVNGSASQPSMASRANPSEVRRIFTMGLPFTAHHGGQILFGPNDGYLYFMMGDGGGTDDPYNFSQNKKSLLGKIMRFDIDGTPSSDEVDQLDLWGNYTIPADNPYAEVKGLAKEIWAMGLRNPWRCSFDSTRPSYFICADVGQDHYEEVDLITKEGNYGWRVYEGPYLFSPSQSPGGNTTPSSIKAIFPVMGYNHSEVNTSESSASITGGYFYRSTTDPCMYGKYLYADLYAGAIWAGSENPIDSGKFASSKISFNCAHDSPINCSFSPESSLPALSYIFSFGEDNKKDVYLLTNSGVYRIVRASRCNYMCAKEDTSNTNSPSPRSEAGCSRDPYSIFIVLTSFLYLIFINYYVL